MNYRHIYHAGNFADVHKHLVFSMVLRYLQQKEKGMLVLDAFAGIGLYDLKRPEAQKTEEYKAGVEKFMASPLPNPDLRDFQKLLHLFWAGQSYAGSPLIAAHLLRAQDRLVVNELHPEDFETLQQNLKGFRGIQTTHIDAYQSIRAHLPPPERRGIILIDPPFEKPDEFQILLKQMQDWHRRWPTGCMMIWYPIKAGQPVSELHQAAQEMDWHRAWVSEILLRKRDLPGGLNGSGLLVLNTPFSIPERVEALSQEFCQSLGGDCWLENKMLTED